MARWQLAAAGVLAALAPAGAAGPPPAGGGHELTVTVTGVRARAGGVVIALFTTPAGFPDDVTRAARTATADPGRPAHTFAGLPAGEYVVVVFHDTNGNGRVDKTAFGFPKEPIGLSNHPTFGPRGGGRPDFGRAKVAVPRAAAVEVNLIELGF